MADEPRYRFGPLEQHGFLMGLRGGQVAVLGGGLLTAFGILVGTQQRSPLEPPASAQQNFLDFSPPIEPAGLIEPMNFGL